MHKCWGGGGEELSCCTSLGQIYLSPPTVSGKATAHSKANAPPTMHRRHWITLLHNSPQSSKAGDSNEDRPVCSNVSYEVRQCSHIKLGKAGVQNHTKPASYIRLVTRVWEASQETEYTCILSFFTTVLFHNQAFKQASDYHWGLQAGEHWCTNTHQASWIYRKTCNPLYTLWIKTGVYHLQLSCI